MFLQKLENDVDILESFKNSISGYVNWWTRMNMSMNQQAESIEQLSRMYSNERNKKVVDKWEQISDDFRKYTDRVSRSPHCFFNFESVTCYILADHSWPDAPTSRPKPRHFCTTEDRIKGELRWCHTGPAAVQRSSVVCIVLEFGDRWL